jgi:hypothetical protein
LQGADVQAAGPCIGGLSGKPNLISRFEPLDSAERLGRMAYSPPVAPSSRAAFVGMSKLDAYAASTLFRPSFLERVAQGSHLDVLDQVPVGHLRGADVPVGAFLERLYSEMFRTYRNEYIYKNELVRRVFLARHNPDVSTVLTEVPVAAWAGRVDLIVVNGTTTAYEVKTDFDDLDRLERQTAISLRLFDRVCVVCSESWGQRVENETDDRVGVLVLQDGGSIATRRRPADNANNVSAEAVFDCLRTAEYTEALERYVGHLPSDLRSVDRYEFCKPLFSSLPARTAHQILHRALRARFVRPGPADDIQGLPYGLAHLYYRLKPALRGRLLNRSVLERPTG